jgi:hypothetical protein
VQVPALELNAFDLAVIDHSSHFTRASLVRVANAAGLRILADGCDWVHNCHTLLLGSGEAKTPGERYDNTGEETVMWLQRALPVVAESVGGRDYGIFGTGMAGLWLTTQFDRTPSFVVDEDPARIGKQVQGISVVTPADAPIGLPVVMAFMSASGNRIASRLRETCPGWANRPVIFFPET